jgi:hypothetical protein
LTTVRTDRLAITWGPIVVSFDRLNATVAQSVRIDRINKDEKIGRGTGDICLERLLELDPRRAPNRVIGRKWTIQSNEPQQQKSNNKREGRETKIAVK